MITKQAVWGDKPFRHTKQPVWGDPRRWLITRTPSGYWLVIPPTETFWGQKTRVASFAAARSEFIRRTAHVRRRSA